MFTYEAVDRAGATVRGEVLAASEDEALRQLQSRELMPVRLAPRAAAAAASVRNRARAPDAIQAALLVRELATLLGGGVPLAEAIEGLAHAHRDDGAGPPLERMNSALRGGTAFAAALRDSGLPLPGYVVQLAEAGELTGRLAQSLTRAADQMDYEAGVRADMKSALIYPVILVASGIVATLTVFLFVVPKFATLIKNPRANIPDFSRWVIETGVFLRDHQMWLGLGGAALVAAAVVLLGTAENRRRLADAALGLPLIGTWLREVDTARWTSMLATLLEARVPLIRALELARGTAQLSGTRNALALAADDVKGGQRLADALESHGAMTTLGASTVRVGERSGELARMLQTVATIHQNQGRLRMKRFLAVLEPAAILVIGGVVAMIMVSIVLAITSLSNLTL
jgi:general secretion pathway protein F